MAELDLGRRDPVAALVELDRLRAQPRLPGLELGESAPPGLDARLRVANLALPSPELFRRLRQRCLASGEVGFLSVQLRGALAQLLPQRGDAGTALFEFGGALPRRLLAAALTLRERLPGGLEVGSSLGHVS